MTLPAVDIAQGAQLGKYEILRKLATGGMAEIYLARVRGTAGFEKLVVLKRILPAMATNPTFVRMFLDEARLAATLQHPNIADVYDVGEADGQYFFTMEYVYGEDVRAIRIASYKRREMVPLQVALAIIHGTASALDYAHEKAGPDGKPLGIVHRDVSASNILVSYDGAVKLVDFGIARATATQTVTQTGTLKGKIPYMSPEQCQGKPLDRRSDLWSLGVVLYELTTNRRPFHGDSDFAIMEQIVHGGAAPPSSAIADYPMDLEAIAMRLLARDPAARFQTGEQVVDALEAVMSARNLWASAKPLGRYMRTLFADKVSAAAKAADEGVPLDEFVALTITGESKQWSLLTPPSAITALPPSDFAQFERGSKGGAAPYDESAVYPTLARKRPWLAIAAVAALVVGVGVFALTRGGDGKPTGATTTMPVTTAPETGTTTGTPATATTPTPAPSGTATTTPATATKPAAPTSTTTATTTATTAKPTTATTATTTTAKPTTPAKPVKPKEQPKWDPNSPFLPPN